MSDTSPPGTPTPPAATSLAEFLGLVRAAVVAHVPRRAWVKAELAEVANRSGHTWITLTEHDEAGAQVAKTAAVIWRTASSLISRFENESGVPFRAGIKVLVRVEASFDPAWGFRIVVHEIDPSFSLGDMAAKVAAIRRRLTEEGLHGRNQTLRLPDPITRLAVLAPAGAAGLQDFQVEARKLADLGLCRFRFFDATFQGPSAKESMLAALRDVYRAARAGEIDAVAIIRGGGSATDLAWLNEFELAQAICVMPVPVVTGIGHDHDRVVLDEVARQVCSTPSKVAEFIKAGFKREAAAIAGLLSDFESRARALAHRGLARYNALDGSFKHQVNTVLAEARRRVQQEQDDLQSASREWLARAEAETRAASAVVHRQRSRMDEHRALLEDLVAGLRDAAAQAQSHAATRLSRADGVLHSQLGRLQAERRNVEQTLADLQIQARSSLRTARGEAREQADVFGRLAVQAHAGAESELNGTIEELESVSLQGVVTARRDLERAQRELLGFGPEPTIRRGFALVRKSGRVVMNKADLVLGDEVQVQLRDGSVSTIVKEIDV